MTEEHVITATEAAWIEAQHHYNALADKIVSSERTINGSHGLHADSQYTCTCGESFTSWSSAKEHLHETIPDTAEPDAHTTELLAILTHIENLTGSNLIADIVSDARRAIESGTDPDDVQEELTEAVTIAVEADYRQRVIDALMLATDHLDNSYSVPGGNLPDEILPSDYPDDLPEHGSPSPSGDDE